MEEGRGERLPIAPLTIDLVAQAGLFRMYTLAIFPNQ